MRVSERSRLVQQHQPGQARGQLDQSFPQQHREEHGRECPCRPVPATPERQESDREDDGQEYCELHAREQRHTIEARLERHLEAPAGALERNVDDRAGRHIAIYQQQQPQRWGELRQRDHIARLEPRGQGVSVARLDAVPIAADMNQMSRKIRSRNDTQPVERGG